MAHMGLSSGGRRKALLCMACLLQGRMYLPLVQATALLAASFDATLVNVSTEQHSHDAVPPCPALPMLASLLVPGL